MTRSTFLKNLIGLYEIAACLGNGEAMRANLSAAADCMGLTVLRGPRIIGKTDKSGVLELVPEPRQYA